MSLITRKRTMKEQRMQIGFPILVCMRKMEGLVFWQRLPIALFTFVMVLCFPKEQTKAIEEKRTKIKIMQNSNRGKEQKGIAD